MKISMSTMKTISNEYLTVVIDPQGAEMQSLKHTASGREYLWQGDPAYWEGRSPILFPAVGGLWDGTYRYNGQTYPMPKHGFMRDKLWQVAEERSDSLTLTYEGPQEETDRQAFPWAPTEKPVGLFPPEVLHRSVSDCRTAPLPPATVCHA